EQFNLEGDVAMDTSFQDDLNADSVDILELIMSVEDEFEIEVEEEELEDISTVGDVVEYIENVKNVD
ncbi:MAG TPA: acyl carrier protein, partial [Tissierellales bacterium]|nr:acyl carrier protein [Tissierellales bacterium]